MTTDRPPEIDVELRLIDPKRNAFRLYGLTATVTLFGERCLRIQWGRIGNRRVRERTETFPDDAALQRRRGELLERRRRHGYQLVAATPDADSSLPSHELKRPSPAQHRDPSHAPPSPATARARATERDIVEAHGLALGERAVQQLVSRWHEATSALARYLEERRAEHLDLVDISTLAAMYVDALAS